MYNPNPNFTSPTYYPTPQFTEVPRPVIDPARNTYILTRPTPVGRSYVPIQSQPVFQPPSYPILPPSQMMYPPPTFIPTAPRAVSSVPRSTVRSKPSKPLKHKILDRAHSLMKEIEQEIENITPISDQPTVSKINQLLSKAASIGKKYQKLEALNNRSFKDDMEQFKVDECIREFPIMTMENIYNDFFPVPIQAKQYFETSPVDPRGRKQKDAYRKLAETEIKKAEKLGFSKMFLKQRQEQWGWFIHRNDRDSEDYSLWGDETFFSNHETANRWSPSGCPFCLQPFTVLDPAFHRGLNNCVHAAHEHCVYGAFFCPICERFNRSTDLYRVRHDHSDEE
jgi:hypothetical protein